MGLDFNSVKFLLWAKNQGVAFDRTLTLGHQGFSCSPARFTRALKDFGIAGTAVQINRCFSHEPFTPLFADEFFRFLGATEVDSVDRSDFEGSTMLHDLNKPFPEKVRSHFDLVVDGGTLEHIFDYPSALRHCLEVLRVGGHFVSITPASGQMGHGFYQFSPELFFRVFSAENGFAIRKIILFDGSKTESEFYAIKDPSVTGQRSELKSGNPMQMAVLARKLSEVRMFAKPPQQSDYAAIWKKHQQAGITGRADCNSDWLRRVRLKVNPYWPYWLRRWRDSWRHRWQRGFPNLNNQRSFRRLSSEHIYSERGDS